MFNFSVCNGQIIKCANFYEEVVPNYNLTTFRTHFRMSSTVFEVILGQVAGYPEFIKRNQIIFGGQTQVNAEKTILIALWTLATPESYRSVGDRFGVGKSTVFKCIHLVVDIVIRYLCRMFLKWPREEEREGLSFSYRTYGLPNVLGAVDGCHIRIKKPIENPHDYFNRKKYFSVVLQGICASNLQFIDVDCRWPGSVHDARIFRTSDIYPVGFQLCAPNYYIIGDAAYPCKSWVVTPYRNNGHLTPPQINFNLILSKTRVKIEHAFALLKGRFRRLMNYLDMLHQERIVKTVVACCILHNICLLHGADDVQEYIDEGLQHLDLVFDPGFNNDEQEDNGNHLRNFLTQYLWDRRHHR